MYGDDIMATTSQRNKGFDAKGYAAMDSRGKLVPFRFRRRKLGPKDVLIDILYCGVCHSDIHTVRGEWHGAEFPIVPGHEILGRVVALGSSAKKFKKGDIAGVGVMVDSCRKCAACKANTEQFCENGVFTYDSKDPHGGNTQGGYSDRIVVDEGFAYRIRHKRNLAAVAPLMCAGITTYSPLRKWGAKKGARVGVVGLGGLGHMAVKLAKSMGARVTVFTTSKGKVRDARRLGAKDVVLSKEKGALERRAKSLDLIIDTVSAVHDVNRYLSMLVPNGVMVVVGLPERPYTFDPRSVIMGNKALAGSVVGGRKQTQEMLDYCARHNITSDIELIPIQRVNEAHDRTVRSDVKYRFVIDMKSLKK